MEKLNRPVLLTHLLCWLFMVILCLSANAQKLPNTQQGSLRAPDKAKADGKANEWGEHLQAYNNATQVFYTIANDDEKLYLVIQTNDPLIIPRIMGGGITLGIQKEGNKTDKNSISITYPITEQTPYFSLRRKSLADEDTTTKAADSIMLHNNTLIGKHCKWIKVQGIAGLDTLISVYNDDGIKAASLFNNKKTYTYELAVNLKLLNISVNDNPKFTYHISLNGGKATNSFKVRVTVDNAEVANNLQEKLNAFAAQQSAPTDFWGEYTLVK